MSREVVLATLVLVLCGAGVWLTSWLPAASPGRDPSRVSGRTLERQSWRRLWLPMLPSAIMLAALLGWALQEPAVTDELLRPPVLLIALPTGLLWLRCAGRACLALRRPRQMPLAATSGLLRPRVVIAAELGRRLDPEALAAAIAHERAHVRHLDPLRIWLAQIVTDAQWPSPTARQRFDRWLAALELARDEEARLGGVRGEDLAAAVVAVARMAPQASPGLAAGLTGAEASLASRVHRLLHPLPSDTRAPAFLLPVVIVSLVVAAIVGVEHGDWFLRALPFIAT